MAVVLAAVFALILSLSRAAESSAPARGWGDGIVWHSMDVAKQVAKATNRPIMYVVHKSWCGACKRLKPLFAASDEIVSLSSHFAMVNLGDDEEPKDAQFAPDGGYIPRILFGAPNGRVDSSIRNDGGNPKYAYFYTDAASIAKSMRAAVSKYGKGSSDEL